MLLKFNIVLSVDRKFVMNDDVKNTLEKKFSIFFQQFKRYRNSVEKFRKNISEMYWCDVFIIVFACFNEKMSCTQKYVEDFRF